MNGVCYNAALTGSADCGEIGVCDEVHLLLVVLIVGKEGCVMACISHWWCR